MGQSETVVSMADHTWFAIYSDMNIQRVRPGYHHTAVNCVGGVWTSRDSGLDPPHFVSHLLAISAQNDNLARPFLPVIEPPELAALPRKHRSNLVVFANTTAIGKGERDRGIRARYFVEEADAVESSKVGQPGQNSGPFNLFGDILSCA